ncbi:MAG TPA: DNA alkylation repair protein [Blastocatellia bacterium]|nr:DNA alkylation repair protein [Blastocatellia bacterium]
MTVEDVIKELESLGTEQNRKIFKRHGMGENLYGVSSADLNKLKKRIKVDHELARRLWETGNYDARALATLIADPRLLDDGQLESWAKSLDSYAIADMFARLASRTALAKKKMERWIKSKDEWTARAGWQMLGSLARDDAGLPEDYFEPYLGIIEQKIQSSKNRVKDAMNNALISIGVRTPRLHKRAVEVARKIGRVEVDHGETGCKTPDAIPYMARMLERAAKQ